MYVYIGLGANEGDKKETMSRALKLLPPAARVRQLSPIYSSAPMYITEQPRFLNQVALIETPLPPSSLLQICQRIEQQLGRKRSPTIARYSPRTIDIDLELAALVPIPHQPGEYIMSQTMDLTLPHPRLLERAFVLRPLADIAPDLILPHGLPLANALTNVIEQDCERIGL
jgi:2-amino-4-hydroxy-6-hydroxymethyldihydropteridine diphosphokinase